MTASLPTRIGIALGVVVALLFGLWVASGLIAPTYLTSIAFGVAWFVLASVGLGKAVKKRPDLKWWVRGTFIATAVVCGALFAWTSLRDKTVNEDVAVGVPVTAAAGPPVAAGTKPGRTVPEKNIALASGEFEVADEGSADGKATVVALAGPGNKRVLTLTGFAVANGPDLRVYLVPGDGRDTGDHVDLGGLKGNKGNQQYDLPSDVDIGKNRTVVIWCRAFSVAFARATLRG